MDEKYIKKIYDNLGGESVFGNYELYHSRISSDKIYSDKIYNNFGEDILGDKGAFDNLIVKKKKILYHLPIHFKRSGALVGMVQRPFTNRNHN